MEWSLSLSLNSNGPVRYSDKEKAVFALLRRHGNRPVDTIKLLHSYYDGRPVPFNGQVALNGTIRSLVTKVERNKEPFRIRKSERRGPHPMEYWIEKK